MAKEDWDAIWAGQEVDLATDSARLDEEVQTLRWRRMAEALDEHLGGPAGLETIEVGAGLGDLSLILNRLGARTTLADYSEPAIEKGRERFAAHGLAAEFVLADMLAVPESLRGRFDLSFSLGVAEHFTGAARQAIVDAHAAVLRPGGLTFISVPYRFAPAYRLWKWRMTRDGTWTYGLEVPFSRRELRRRCEAAGLRTVGFIQSSFLADWDRFFPQHGLRRRFADRMEQPSRLDAFGYAVTYVGVR